MRGEHFPPEPDGACLQKKTMTYKPVLWCGFYPYLEPLFCGINLQLQFPQNDIRKLYYLQ
jgi:hypothetical protein